MDLRSIGFNLTFPIDQVQIDGFLSDETPCLSGIPKIQRLVFFLLYMIYSVIYMIYK